LGKGESKGETKGGILQLGEVPNSGRRNVNVQGPLTRKCKKQKKKKQEGRKTLR